MSGEAHKKTTSFCHNYFVIIKKSHNQLGSKPSTYFETEIGVVDIVSVLQNHKSKHCPILLITPLTLKRNQYNQQEKLVMKNELLYVYIL